MCVCKVSEKGAWFQLCWPSGTIEVSVEHIQRYLFELSLLWPCQSHIPRHRYLMITLADLNIRIIIRIMRSRLTDKQRVLDAL